MKIKSLPSWLASASKEYMFRDHLMSLGSLASSWSAWLSKHLG